VGTGYAEIFFDGIYPFNLQSLGDMMVLSDNTNKLRIYNVPKDVATMNIFTLINENEIEMQQIPS
jgi:hypothetical protein